MTDGNTQTSKGGIQQFFAAVSQEASLQEKLRVASDPESIVKVGNDSGYDFTRTDVEAVIKTIATMNNVWQEQLTAMKGKGIDFDFSPSKLGPAMCTWYTLIL